MKTAVTMLGEAFRQWQKDWDSYDKGICDKPKSYDEFISPFIELEKEQIIEAGNACSIKTIVHKEKLDEMSKDELRDSLVEDTISYGEEYYNQTYNQNK
jgi:hypothetical protein